MFIMIMTFTYTWLYEAKRGFVIKYDKALYDRFKWKVRIYFQYFLINCFKNNLRVTLY